MLRAFRLALFLSIQWILHGTQNSYVSIWMSQINTYERRILQVSNGCRNVISQSKALDTCFRMTYRTAAFIGCSWRAIHERVRFGLERPNRSYTFMHRSPRVCVAQKRAICRLKAWNTRFRTPYCTLSSDAYSKSSLIPSRFGKVETLMV